MALTTSRPLTVTLMPSDQTPSPTNTTNMLIDWPTIHKMYKDGIAKAGITNPAKSNEVILKTMVDYMNAILIRMGDEMDKLREFAKFNVAQGRGGSNSKVGFQTMCYCGTIHSSDDEKCPGCGRK